MLRVRPPVFNSLRLYSQLTEKPTVKLVAQLRKLTEVSIIKAREALAASNNDVSAALAWLQNDLAVSGAQKAAKLSHRAAGEGLVGASVLARGTGSGAGHGGVRAALVELNCETDFVARNALFARLVADVVHTAAFLAEPAEPESDSSVSSSIRPVPRAQLLDAPLLSAEGPTPSPVALSSHGTVADAIRTAMAKLGENIVLQRAAAVAHEPVSRTRSELGLRVATYAHGQGGAPLPPSQAQGRVGALALIALKSPRLQALLGAPEFRGDLERVERALARQIVGFDTPAIRGEEGALYGQPFMMLGDALEGETVEAGLGRWAREKQLILDTDGGDTGGIQVMEYLKWTVGESPDAT
ncbi:elongation factor TS-domain-containing protein [Lactarius sanguifluus]|nr:elongation factor TS-domain-containing protein [Lactarius sanguifluus]